MLIKKGGLYKAVADKTDISRWKGLGFEVVEKNENKEQNSPKDMKAKILRRGK